MGLFYKSINELEKAKNYLELASSYGFQNLTTEMYLISSQVELIYTHLHLGNIDSAKEVLNHIDITNPHLLKKFAFIRDKYGKAELVLSKSREMKGVIISIDDNMTKAVIVDPFQRKHTYVAKSRNFIELITINESLINRQVKFITSDEKLLDTSYHMVKAVRFV